MGRPSLRLEFGAGTFEIWQHFAAHSPSAVYGSEDKTELAGPSAPFQPWNAGTPRRSTPPVGCVVASSCPIFSSTLSWSSSARTRSATGVPASRQSALLGAGASASCRAGASAAGEKERSVYVSQLCTHALPYPFLLATASCAANASAGTDRRTRCLSNVTLQERTDFPSAVTDVHPLHTSTCISMQQCTVHSQNTSRAPRSRQHQPHAGLCL